MKVYLIGAGPGDPELITIKAMHAISLCDTVVYDDLIPKEILLFAPRDAARIYVGKRAGRNYMKQPEINDLLVSLAKKGHTIARLKGGDPCIFGRGGEEALYLREHGVPFEIIPGISSAVAGPISAGIPPTHRGYASSVKFVTAHEDPSKESGFLDWANLAHDSGTIIFLMGAQRIASIAEKLMAEGMSGEIPCALVQDATTPAQRHVVSTLHAVGEDALQHKISSPCIMVVGKVMYNASIFIFPDVSKTIAESCKCLRPGGKIAFSFYPQLVGEGNEDLFDVAFRRLGEPLPRFRVITGYSKAAEALDHHCTSICHHRWERPLDTRFLQDFFSIPAQSASLFPNRGYEARCDLVKRLFATLADMTGKGRIVWRMAEGTKSGSSVR